MRWPWVNREIIDIQHRAFRAAHDRLVDEVTNLRVERDAVLDKYHALKLQGASTPEPKPTLERPTYDPVMGAITAKAGGDRRLRATMSRQAMSDRALGVPEQEIIQRIEQGVTLEDEGIPA